MRIEWPAVASGSRSGWTLLHSHLIAGVHQPSATSAFAAAAAAAVAGKSKSREKERETQCLL